MTKFEIHSDSSDSIYTVTSSGWISKFEVHSDSSDSIYTVTLENGVYNCSCKWGQVHENGVCSCFKVCSGKTSVHYCKHIHQVNDTKKSVYIDVGAPKCAECKTNDASKNEYYPDSQGGEYWTLCDVCFEKEENADIVEEEH